MQKFLHDESVIEGMELAPNFLRRLVSLARHADDVPRLCPRQRMGDGLAAIRQALVLALKVLSRHTRLHVIENRLNTFLARIIRSEDGVVGAFDGSGGH